MHEGVISYWYKAEGDPVETGEPLYVVETDKASVEIESGADGVLLKIFVKEGESAPVGGCVAIIGEAGESIQSSITKTQPQTNEEKTKIIDSENIPPKRIKASPAAKRKAKAEKIRLENIQGSGHDGLITERDVEAYLKTTGTSETESGCGSEETILLQGIPKAMADRMAQSAAIPQVTTVAETDVTELMNVSKETSVTITSFVVRAVVEGLKGYPIINSSLSGEHIIIKKYFNIGISVATPHGLMVPIIHNAERKDIYQISKKLAELAEKAREKRLGLEEISNGTFTVTNSGVFGSLLFTPRIQPPESAILGMGKISKQPVVRNDGIMIRTMIYLNLSYDHRIIDGENAVKFLQEVKKALEDPKRLT